MRSEKNQTLVRSEIRLITRLLNVEDRLHVGRRLLVMLICHIDESGGNETFTMACAISDDRGWLRLDREWRRTLSEFDISHFHMKKLVARKAPYAAWPQSRCDALTKKLIHVFREHVLGWCASTVVIKDFFETVKTDRKRKRRNPYYHAFSTILSGAIVFSDTSPYGDSISFVVDRGGASRMRLFLDFTSFAQIEGVPKDKLGLLVFGDDEKNNGLQAADLLAYEVHKHHQGFQRRSYAALCGLPHVDDLCDAMILKEMFKNTLDVLI